MAERKLMIEFSEVLLLDSSAADRPRLTKPQRKGKSDKKVRKIITTYIMNKTKNVIMLIFRSLDALIMILAHLQLRQAEM